MEKIFLATDFPAFTEKPRYFAMNFHELTRRSRTATKSETRSSKSKFLDGSGQAKFQFTKRRIRLRWIKFQNKEVGRIFWMGLQD
jgi:hypothetical protein